MTDYLEHDPELHDGQRQDLHSLRARDPGLDALAAEIQKTAAAHAARGFSETAMIQELCCGRAILITGAAGYLGATMVFALQELGLNAFGIDVVEAPTVDKIVDVANLDTLRQSAHGCGAVFHTAALHAPHALSWHAREFVATNVRGTENVVSLGLPMVHTSTTSLTITNRVKQREQAGDCVWLDDLAQRAADVDESWYSSSLDAPRNKYGRTKLAAEEICLKAAGKGHDVCVLRAPRFFPEDVLEESTDISLENVKANELLGRRCALVDLVDAQLRALARIQQLRGSLLTIVAPCPLERSSLEPADCSNSEVTSAASHLAPSRKAAALLRATFPHAEATFAQYGWQLPGAITRIYDCSAAMRALDWKPRITFEVVLQALQRVSSSRHAERDEQAEDRVRDIKRQKVTVDELHSAIVAHPFNAGVIDDECLLRGAY